MVVCISDVGIRLSSHNDNARLKQHLPDLFHNGTNSSWKNSDGTPNGCGKLHGELRPMKPIVMSTDCQK